MLISRTASPTHRAVSLPSLMSAGEEPRRQNGVSKPASAVSNALLSALNASELGELLSHFERVPLRRRQVLQERNLPLTHAYFIERGLASVLSRAGERGTVEVGTVGAKGFVGVPIVLGTLRSPHRCVVQVPGEAIRISADALGRAMDQIPRLRTILLGYVQAAMVQSAQLVVCNTRHSLQERLARSLLLAHNRLGSREIPLTHECLSRLLGVRRAGVTSAVGVMERAGLIRRGRGRLVITDAEGLQQASCECYRAINAEHERTLYNSGCHHTEARRSAPWSMPGNPPAFGQLSALPC